MTFVAKWLLYPTIATLIGFIIDLIVGDPHGFPHPVVFIGKLITLFEKLFRRVFKKTVSGERTAGGAIFLSVCMICVIVPLGLLMLLYRLSPIIGVAVESVMCWQILATRSLKIESMRVYHCLERGDIEAARHAVAMIVGRDTEKLDAAGIARATVETVAENTSDGSIAPLFYLALGGAPLGFLYKAVNTMDSMLGYKDPPYTNIGLVPARADDVFNFIPARLSALLMLFGGFLLKMNVKNGFRIFRRDRYKHSSPNSAQTESVAAGLIGVRLGGGASYRGVFHEKPFIGEPLREIVFDDIGLSCRLLYASALLALIILLSVRLAAFVAATI